VKPVSSHHQLCKGFDPVKMIATQIATVVALSSLVLAVPPIQIHGASGSDWKSKIKNVVVLVEENRSFDTFAGGLSYNPTINGLLHHNYCNSMSACFT
jgi:phospholipase C